MPERFSDYKSLCDAIKTHIGTGKPPLIVAIAGPPATGKSTLAETLASDFRALGHRAAYCPMDGFHKPNAQLDSEGLRSFKGRIDSFDAVAFADAVARLASGDAFWWPGFSRVTEEPVSQGIRIEGKETVCVIEGNYLLMPLEPWNRAAAHFDLRIFIDAPDSLLLQRLTERHLQCGYSQSETQDKIAQVDMPNAKHIRQSAHLADITYLPKM